MATMAAGEIHLDEGKCYFRHVVTALLIALRGSGYGGLKQESGVRALNLADQRKSVTHEKNKLKPR